VGRYANKNQRLSADARCDYAKSEAPQKGKGRCPVGIGPQIGIFFPAFEGYTGNLNIRGYWDVAIENRPTTQFAMVTLSFLRRQRRRNQRRRAGRGN